MNSIQIILYCHKKSREQKYFVAPATILKQFEQENIKYTISNDLVNVMNKKFRIERGGNNAC